MENKTKQQLMSELFSASSAIEHLENEMELAKCRAVNALAAAVANDGLVKLLQTTGVSDGNVTITIVAGELNIEPIKKVPYLWELDSDDE